MKTLAAAAATALVLSAPAAGGSAARTCTLRAGEAKAVWFRASDGRRVAGAVWGKGRRGVVLAHERNASLCSWAPFARVLAARGYQALAFDFRGSGLTPAPLSLAAMSRFDADVEGAAGELRRRGSRRIVVAGASLGGTAAVYMAAKRYPAVAGAISLSAPRTQPGMGAEAAVKRSRVPLLIVAARDDGDFATDARKLYAAAATTDKTLEIVSRPGHGSELLLGREGAPLRTLLLRWIDQHTR